jgi:hypothetical protein
MIQSGMDWLLRKSFHPRLCPARAGFGRAARTAPARPEVQFVVGWGGVVDDAPIM